MKRIGKVAAGLTAIALMATLAPAGAYTVPRGRRDRALLSLTYPDSGTAYYVNVSMWGTGYYGGIPPREQGGLGDVVVCLGLYPETVSVDGCVSNVSPAFDSLRTMTLQEDVSLKFVDHDDVVTTETVAIALTVTGAGPVFPGAGAGTNPSPGVEADVSLWRNATVSGTISSPSLGVVDFSEGRAVLGRDFCLAVMAGRDDVEACRY